MTSAPLPHTDSAQTDSAHANSTQGLTLSPSDGPSDPSGSTPHVGLFPTAPVLEFTFEDAGRQVLASAFTPTAEAPLFRFAIWPELVDGEHSSSLLGLVAATDNGDIHPRDQHGWTVRPGEHGVWVSEQWNLVELDLSALVGQQVKLVAVSPSGQRGHGWLQLLGPAAAPATDLSPLQLAHTNRGTHQTASSSLSRGNTFPQTNVPHGYHFLTPITDARANRWLYSWHGRPNDPDARPSIQALAVSHCASPWMADRLAFQLMPWTGKAEIDPLARERHYDHADETDHPHHYRVQLDDGVVAEMTPTSRAAVFRFDFAATDTPDRGVILDQPGGGELTISRLNDGRISFTAFIDPPPDWEVDGRAPLAGYIYGETRQPVEVLDVISREGIPELPGTLGRAITRHWPRWARVKMRRRQAGAVRLTTGDTLEVVLASSQISTQQARHNLNLEIGLGTFDQVRGLAEQRWSDLLGRLELVGGTHDQRVSAYSNLARLYSWPNEHHENTAITATEPNWVYASPFQPLARHHERHQTGAVVVAGKTMVNNGYWDTFRTCWPAYHLFTPRHATELLDGIVQHYLDGGWMARWSAPGYCDIMVGTSSDAIFADAAAHGVAFNELAGYDSALRNACVPSPGEEVGRKGIDRGRFTGYIDTDTHEGFSWSMDNANSDAALAVWSQRLAERDADPARRQEFRANAIWFAHRALGYQQLFDPNTGFFRARTPDGDFRLLPPFDPQAWGLDYTETNAWGMAFHAPFDGAGLASLVGGEDQLAAKLEEALATPEPASLLQAVHNGHYGSVLHEQLEARALRLGQIGMSNQPAHHIPFMFTHTGQHHRTQWLVREIVERAFTGSAIGQGYPGDEDNGEMSAWWLLAAAGLYPLAVGSGEMVLTAPLFERFAFRRDDGTVLEVRAGNIEHRYIQSLTVNGQPWHRVTMDVADLAGDVVLQYELGPEPSDWARDSRPRSISSLVPGGRWQGDLTSREGVQVTSTRPGESPEPAELCSDRPRTHTFVAGEVIEIQLPSPARAQIWTLTTAEVAAAPVRAEVCELVDGTPRWRPVSAPRPALWRQQTQAYLLFEDGQPREITGLRLVCDAEVDLVQLEIY